MPSDDLMDLELNYLDETIDSRNPGTNRFSFVRQSFAGDTE
jgi:hypothetical protein